MKYLAVVLLFGACGDNASDPPPPTPDAPACQPAATKTVYLNRTGGTYTKAPVSTDDDSSTNVSNVLTADVTLAAPNVVEVDWTAVIDCVKSKFTPFAVEFTEIDPGAAEHIELVVIDTSTQIGVGAGIGSVSPFNCNRIPAAIPFMMWAGFTNADRCWTMAQTLANTFGLDHVLECTDLMTFMTGCGASDAKTFTDTAVQCGEFTARACCSGQPLQNSAAKLMANAGPSCN